MISNKRTNKVISRDEKICKNMFSKALGLMFSPKKNVLMIFNKEKNISLHNFFVFYSINLLLINKEKKVIEIKKNFKPFMFYTSKKKAMYLLETPFTVDVKVNDELLFK